MVKQKTLATMSSMPNSRMLCLAWCQIVGRDLGPNDIWAQVAPMTADPAKPSLGSLLNHPSPKPMSTSEVKNPTLAHITALWMDLRV